MDAEIPMAKNSGTFRIFVLGDSFTEAIQVPSHKNFSKLLQKLLNNQSLKQYKKIEVINTGVSGYSPLNYYLYFKRELARFQPDLVLVQLFANDVFEDNTARAKSILDEHQLPVSTGRYFNEKIAKHLSVNSQAFNHTPMGYRMKRFFIEHSRFFEYMYVKIYNWQKASDYHQKMIRVDEYGTGYQFFILDPKHQLSKDDAFRERAWGYTQKYLLALKGEVEKSGAGFALFYMPMEVQLALDMYGEHVSLYISKQMGTHFNDMLAGFSVRNKILFHDLLPDFELHKTRKLYLSRDGHLTMSGHAVAADALFDFIVRNNLISKQGE